MNPEPGREARGSPDVSPVRRDLPQRSLAVVVTYRQPSSLGLPLCAGWDAPVGIDWNWQPPLITTKEGVGVLLAVETERSQELGPVIAERAQSGGTLGPWSSHGCNVDARSR